MWLILALLCVGVGLVMYAGLQPEIPDELTFLKTKPQAAVVVTQEAAPLPTITATSWSIRSSGDSVEISRDFLDEIQSSTQSYDRPTFILTCYQNQLYARIDTRLHTRGVKTTNVGWQGHTQLWTHGERQNIFAPDAKQVLQSTIGRESVSVSLEFDEAPRQTLRLPLEGFAQAAVKVKQQCGIK